MMQDTEKEIETARANVERLTGELAVARADLDALYVRRSTERFGIEVGMKVRDRKGQEYVVTMIQPGSWRTSKPWLYGNPIKKDGTPGRARRCIYDDWEIVAR